MKIVEVIPVYLGHCLFPGPDFEKKGEFQVHFHFFLTDIWLVIVDGPIGVQTIYIFNDGYPLGMQASQKVKNPGLRPRSRS